MMQAIGWFLLLSGALSLVFNEFTVGVRRVWPWRRDDTDPVRDQRLDEFYRLHVYLGSIVCIEIGAILAEFALPDLLFRTVVYAGFGGWLLYHRPAMRRSCFWLSLPYRGSRPVD